MSAQPRPDQPEKGTLEQSDFERLLHMVVDETKRNAEAEARVRQDYLERQASRSDGEREFEARAKMLTRLRLLSIQHTHPQDWVVHSAPDGSMLGIPSSAACLKIAPLWGIEITNIRPKALGGEFEPEKIPKGNDGAFTLRCWADGHSRISEAAVSGVEASRDSDEEFLGRDTESDHRSALYTLAMSKVVRILTGLNRVAGPVLDEAWKGQNLSTALCVKGHGFGSSADRRTQKVADVGVPEKVAELKAEVLRRVGGDMGLLKTVSKDITKGPNFSGFDSVERIGKDWQLDQAWKGLRNHPVYGDAAMKRQQAGPPQRPQREPGEGA